MGSFRDEDIAVEYSGMPNGFLGGNDCTSGVQEWVLSVHGCVQAVMQT